MVENYQLDIEKITWNPWLGCHKCSAGCDKCYVTEEYINNKVHINKNKYSLPIRRKRKVKSRKTENYELEYIIKPSSVIYVCTQSDFFIEEADIWRMDAWEYIHKRSDCLFIITTKRTNRIEQCLPDNWLDGWDNVVIQASVEDNLTAWERIPTLFKIPIKHIGIEAQPLLEELNIDEILGSGFIERVSVGGESYKGLDRKAKELEINWVKSLRKSCEKFQIQFIFSSTGSRLRDEKGTIVNVDRVIDQVYLAKFYNYNLDDYSEFDWQLTAEKLELRMIDEEANKIYRKILENSNNKQITLKDWLGGKL